MNHRTTSISITAFTLLLGASFAWGQANVSPDLTAALSTSTIAKTGMSSSAASSDSSSSSSTAAVDIIVQYKTAPTNTQYQAVTTLGGTLVTQYGAVTSAHYSVPKSAVQSLAADGLERRLYIAEPSREGDVKHHCRGRPLRCR